MGAEGSSGPNGFTTAPGVTVTEPSATWKTTSAKSGFTFAKSDADMPNAVVPTAVRTAFEQPVKTKSSAV